MWSKIFFERIRKSIPAVRQAVIGQAVIGQAVMRQAVIRQAEISRDIAGMAGSMILALCFCGTAFAAPVATESDAAEVEGEVFVSPDFVWSGEDPGAFLVRYTVTNGANIAIPETEIRVTLPEEADFLEASDRSAVLPLQLRFSSEPDISGSISENDTLTVIDGRELVLELTDFQVGRTYTISAAGTLEGLPEQVFAGGASTEGASAFRVDPGTMHVSLVLRGYGEEHATALDYRVPDYFRDAEGQPEVVTEPQVLSMLAATLTGTGRGNVTADIVDGPLSSSFLFMNKSGEYSMHIMHFPTGMETDGNVKYPFVLLKILPFLAVLITAFVLYILFCQWDVRRRARVFRFDPLLKTHERR